jgi:primosomal replication protein N
VQLDIGCIGFGAMAREIHRVAPGTLVRISGFLRAARRGSRSMKLHVTQFNEV